MQNDLRVVVPLKDPVDPGQDIQAVVISHPDIVPVALAVAAQVRQEHMHTQPVPVDAGIEAHAVRGVGIAVHADRVPVLLRIIF